MEIFDFSKIFSKISKIFFQNQISPWWKNIFRLDFFLTKGFDLYVRFPGFLVILDFRKAETFALTLLTSENLPLCDSIQQKNSSTNGKIMKKLHFEKNIFFEQYAFGKVYVVQILAPGDVWCSNESQKQSDPDFATWSMRW